MTRRSAAILTLLAICATGAWALEINDSEPQQVGETDAGMAYSRDIDLVTGNVDYRLAVRYVEADAGETFLQAIGLLSRQPGARFSKRGWYAGGFIHATLGEMNLFDSPVTITVTGEGALFAFDTEQGEATLLLASEPQSEILFATLDLPEPNDGAQITLTAYPGDYNKGEYEKNDRWIATAQREVQHGESAGASSVDPVSLEPVDEPWIYCFDRKNNPAGNTWLSTNAVLYNPSEVSDAQVQVGNYSVLVTLDYPAETDAAHLMLWEFPGTDHDQALEYMRSLVIEVEG